MLLQNPAYSHTPFVQPKSKFHCRTFYKVPAVRIGRDTSWFGVGSLPHRDPAAALYFIESHSTLLPFWPELPALGEYMLARAERALSPTWRGYGVAEARALDLLPSCWQGKVFPLIKGQLCGAVTQRCYSQEGSLALESLVDRVSREAEFQVEKLSTFGREVLIILDEPGLGGSHRGDEEEVVVKEVQRVRSLGCHVGIHSCARLPSWIWNHLGADEIELLSFDALLTAPYEFLTPHNETEQPRERADLIIAPGTFPGAAPRSDPAILLATGEEEFRRISCAFPHVRLLRSATCGHAGSDEGWLERLYTPRF